MIENAISDEFVYGLLSSIGLIHGLPVNIGLPDFDRPQGIEGESVEGILYWNTVFGDDTLTNALGGRAQSTFMVEIGLASPAQTFGGTIRNSAGDQVGVLDVLKAIDASFDQDFQPVRKTEGLVTSCRRVRPVRLPEVTATGRKIVRNGGVYEIIAKAD